MKVATATGTGDCSGFCKQMSSSQANSRANMWNGSTIGVFLPVTLLSLSAQDASPKSEIFSICITASFKGLVGSPTDSDIAKGGPGWARTRPIFVPCLLIIY